MAYDQDYARKIQDHAHGVAALTMPTGLKMLLMTANGTAAAAGTELATGGGYTAGTGQPIGFSAATAASPSVSASAAVVSYTNMPAGTVVGIEIKDDADVRMEYGALASAKTTASGDTLSFAAGAVTSALS